MRVFAPGLIVDDEFEMAIPDGGVKLMYFVAGRAEPNAQIIPHAHSYHEVFLLAEGSCIQQTDTESRKMQTGDLVIIKSGQVHQVTGSDSEGWRHYCLAFYCNDLNDVDAIFNRSGMSYLANCNDLIQICTRIRDESRQSKVGMTYIIQALITELVVEIARRIGTSNVKQMVNAYSEEVIQARIYIERNSRHGLSVDEIAKAICVSPSLLSRRFSSEMHISIHRYAQQLLMKRAASLLENRKLNVSEIADQLGFSTIHFFSNSFKSFWGVSPTQYQRDTKSSLQNIHISASS